MKQLFDVTGMSCAACRARVEKGVRACPGVSQADVNLLQNILRVAYDPAQVSSTHLQEEVRRAGYGISVRRPTASRARQPVGSDTVFALKRRFWFSVLFLFPLFYMSCGLMWGWR